jgi:para-nitrobenzyl esterase
LSQRLQIPCALLLALTAFGTIPLDAQTVSIDAGQLHGLTVPSLPHGAVFLGIPYAAAPVADLRWRAPQPPVHWAGVRNAAAYGPACPQAPSTWLPEMLGKTSMPTDEDCLYLNVFTPQLAAGTKLPVLVWIHGGGNIEGSAEWPPLGETLAREGVVVVSINYRLGIFGFFASTELSAESTHHTSGNYGQLDQLAALQWVRQNIAHFGGDPGSVTVAGASSGSLDICNLMASPLSAGLFQRAILQSGVCVDSIFPTSTQAAASNSKFSSTSLTQLRSLPAQQLLEAANRDQQLDLEPVIDNWFLNEQPAATFTRGRQLKVPVLVGSNDNEMSIFASSLVGSDSYRPKTVADYHRWLNQRFGDFSNQVFAAYPAHNDAEATTVFTAMDTDFDFTFGAELVARETTVAGQPAFLYHFAYKGQAPFASLGAFHGEESMFLSKKYWSSWIATPEDAKLSDAIIAYWVHFIKTGDPKTAGLPKWPAYNPHQNLCQILDEEITTAPVPRSERFTVFQQRLNRRLANATKQ